jgi:hypothetical protein
MRSAEGIEVTLRLPEFSTALLNKIIPGSLLSTSGPDSKVSVGKSAGYRASDIALQLRLHPIALSDADKSQDVVIHKAYVSEGPAYSYNAAEVSVYEVTFRALLVPSRDQGDQIYSIGTETVAADLTAPTVSLTAPLDGAGSVAVGTNIDWTFSEALDPSFVTLEQFYVIKASDGSLVAGAVSYDSGLFKATFNPTSDLTAATAYIGFATTAVRDVAGNKLATASVINFTTA